MKQRCLTCLRPYKNKESHTPDKIEEAVKGYNSGASLDSVAEFLEVSDTKAKKLLVANGVTMRPRGRPSLEREARAAAAVEAKFAGKENVLAKTSDLTVGEVAGLARNVESVADIARAADQAAIEIAKNTPKDYADWIE